MSPLRVSLVTLLALLLAAPALAQFPAAAGDDTTFSLGKAIIWVNPPFAGLVNTLPGWNDPQPGHWSTPYLFDSSTTIGHSAAHRDGSFTDHNGATVGLAGSTVSDANFTIHPGEGPAGWNEIHTELYKLHLTEPPACALGFAVRAGVGAGVSFPSYGEVEALQGTSDFPAESFFQVYVEIDTPFGILHNVDPLLIHHPSINSLPPTVVYIHGLTPAVKIFFKTGPNRGRLFGYLRLAGHGVGGDCSDPCGDCPAKDDLDAALYQAPLMNCSNADQIPTSDAVAAPVATACAEYHDTLPTNPRPTEPTQTQF